MTMLQTVSPKSRARTLLIERYAGRGNHHSNLWLFYSPKTKMDWVVSSDLEFDHAILLEADQSVLSYDLNPPKLIVALPDESRMTRFDAIVTLKNGTIEWREVKPNEEAKKQPGPRTLRQRETQEVATAQAGVTYRVFTETEIHANLQLILNWRRVIAFMSATRDLPRHDIHDFRNRVALQFKRLHDDTLDNFLIGVDRGEQPQYLSALFDLHQQGVCCSDLDKRPLCLSTRFREASDSL